MLESAPHTMVNTTDEIDDFDDFDIDPFDDAALQQIQELETELTSAPAPPAQAIPPQSIASSIFSAVGTASKGALGSRTTLPPRTSSFGSGFVSQNQSQSASQIHSAKPAGPSRSSLPGQSRFTSSGNAPSQQLPSSSSGARQMTLFGKPAVASSPSRPAKVVTQSPGHITLSSQSAAFDSTTSPGQSFAKARTKQWDREAYLNRENAKNRDKTGSLSAIDVDALDFDDGDDEFGSGGVNWDDKSAYTNVSVPEPAKRELPAVQPRKFQIDREAAETWIYPTNMEKRNYQYNIVQKALFNNVLVALPTGLGKTFIAAVVILNFFRWYPEGKIIFMAPSRPLVDQQKTACHRICGLPWDCAIDLTGSTARARRNDFWQTKRIFYMTPQTFENDLRNGSCDPRDVVCVVVDEAHKAKGRYAYGNVIGLLMEINPHFRVLGLSATPGKDSDSVQEVVDQLHINEIEIRTEEALDVRQYVFRKREEIVNVPMGPDLNRIKAAWAKLMQVHMDPLIKSGLLRPQDPVFLHHFAVNAIARDRSKMQILGKQPHLRANISELAHMALSMQYLMEQSPTMFFERLKERAAGVSVNGKKSGTTKQRIYANTNTTFRDIMRDLEMMQDDKGRVLHPKMVKLKDVLLDHFDQHAIDQLHQSDAIRESGRTVLGGTPSSSGATSETRVMVFCSYRECCNELVRYLNDCGLRATHFVGQSRDNKGNKGMSQREQEQVIQDFKKGVYNVLVATQIGEEGLDIGSVDLTACYEAVKDSIRMLQRIGRTGRKREGKIVVLMSEGREQHAWQHSKDNYRAVQKEIEAKLVVELFDDVDRMVPKDITPRPVLKAVEQPEFQPEMVADHKAAASRKTVKRSKPKKDPRRNMPEGALEGFLKASSLAKKKKTAASRKRKTGAGSDSELGSDDDDGVEGEANESHSQRIKRLIAQDSDEDSDKENSSMSLSRANSKGKQRARRISGITLDISPPSSPTFNIASPLPRSTPAKSLSKSTSPLPTSSDSASKPRKTLGAGLRRSVETSGNGQHSNSPAGCSRKPVEMGDEFDRMEVDFLQDFDTQAVLADIEKTVDELARLPDELTKRPESSPPSRFIPIARPRRPHPIMLALEAEEELNGILIDGDKDDPGYVDGKRAGGGKELDTSTSTRDPTQMSSPSKSLMGPPDSVPRGPGPSRRGRPVAAATEVPSPEGALLSSPIKSLPLRRGRLVKGAISTTPSPTKGSDVSGTKQVKRRKVHILDDEEKAKSTSAAVQSGRNSSKAKGKEKGKSKKRKITNSPTSRALFQWEAERSTDESVHGEQDEDDSGIGSSDEDDTDRAAVGDFIPTQAPRGYNQQSIYLQSMLSQAAPAEFQRFNRAPFPGIGGRFGVPPPPPLSNESGVNTSPVTPRRRGQGHAFTHHHNHHHRAIPSSESRRGGLDSDRYSEDSFVVNDDEDIVYDSDSDGLPDSSQF
ncbi:P-loop containing nucleoside triphosphate hydrolase protein [Testicularia cyperi]|uniref:ATP-dependent DNA helicase n=1 Tax=Testicularia cyperi TaxID=1882483 RepID=A0A317XSR3_9BASI|nr:P-loop containing nucleoside triphosphate hydrolase protein [Testicularia cyperi]